MEHCKSESGGEIVRRPLPMSIGNLVLGILVASIDKHCSMKAVPSGKALTIFDAGDVNFKLFAVELL